MEFLRNKLPKPLRAYDRKLMLSHPVRWSLQLHTIGFWSSILIVLSILTELLDNNSLPTLANQSPNSGFFTGLFSILAVLLFFGWIFLQRSYLTEESFGAFDKKMGTHMAITYAVGIVLIGLPTILPSIISNYKVDLLVSDQSFQEDIDCLNQFQPFFPIDGYQDLNYYEAKAKNFEDFSLNLYPYSTFMQKETAQVSNNNKEETALAQELKKRIATVSAQDLQRYIVTVQKYIGKEGFDHQADVALEQFQNGNASYNADYYHRLNDAVSTINQLKMHGNGWHWNTPLFSWLFFVSVITNITLIFRYLGKKQSIYAVVINLLVFVGLGLLTGLIGVFAGAGYIGMVTIVVAPVLLFFTLRIMLKNRTGSSGITSRYALAIVGSGHFYLLKIMTIVALIGFSMITAIDQVLPQKILALITFLIFNALHFYLILPIFHKTYLRLKARPE